MGQAAPDRPPAVPGARRAGRRRDSPAHRPKRPDVDPARLVAWQLLRAVDERGAYANLTLPGLLRAARLPAQARAVATDFGYGTLRWQGSLDHVLGLGAHRPLATVDPALRDALRLGAYQLVATRTPTHTAVAATVGLARAVSGEGSSRFANAVLRRVAERVEAAGDDLAKRLGVPPYDDDPIGYLALVHAHPRWIVEAFAGVLGGDLAELSTALAADNQRPSTHLVARPGRLDRADLLAQVSVAGLRGSAGPWTPWAVHLRGGDPATVVAVATGLAAVQDEGSQLAVLALTAAPAGAAPGAPWVDLCAGPGGKAALLAGLTPAGTPLLAIEPRGPRAGLVAQALAGSARALVVRADGRTAPLLPASAGRVLVDAPCSGLGALRRRPEARWRRQPGDPAALRPLQVELLTAALDLVRPGGIVAYATCSPHPEETTGVLADALGRRSDAESLDVSVLLPGVPRLPPHGPVQLWPHRHGTDAMFLAVLVRR